MQIIAVGYPSTCASLPMVILRNEKVSRCRGERDTILQIKNVPSDYNQILVITVLAIRFYMQQTNKTIAWVLNLKNQKEKQSSKRY